MILGIIGYGAIVKQALASLAATCAGKLDAVVCLARPEGEERARAMLDAVAPGARTHVVCTADALIEHHPGVVAEAAGHEALITHGAAILGAGRDLIITSVGALADPRLSGTLDRAAALSGARYDLCPGAIGGLDILDAARRSGLTSLLYTSRKPLEGWRGTHAEKLVMLDELAEPTQFFEGSAREAALLFPQNANVAATIALRGLGLDDTRTRLVADPAITRNIHEISIRSACVDVDMRIVGVPSPDNPKTSLTTGFALASKIAAAIEDRERAPRA